MSQHSEELRTKVRAALAARMHRVNKELLGRFAVSRHAIVLLADELSAGVAAAIDRADSEAWIGVEGYRTPDSIAHLNHILDALKGT